jgi:hypothetical protein
MSLFNKLAEIENKLAKLEVGLGNPQRRHLLVRQTITNITNRTTVVNDSLILPQPYITTASPRYTNLQVAIQGADSIFISLNDIQVEIPRVYPKSLFLSDSYTKSTFVIDPPIDSADQIIYSNPAKKELVGHYFYKLIFLSENEPTVWKLILSRERDMQKAS